MECPKCGSKLAKLLVIKPEVHCASCGHDWTPVSTPAKERTKLETLQSKVDYFRDLCQRAGDTATTDLMDEVFGGSGPKDSEIPNF